MYKWKGLVKIPQIARTTYVIIALVLYWGEALTNGSLFCLFSSFKHELLQQLPQKNKPKSHTLDTKGLKCEEFEYLVSTCVGSYKYWQVS